MNNIDSPMAFPPIKREWALLESNSQTNLTVTSASDLDIKLGVTFYANGSAPIGYILSGTQSVHTKVIINFSRQLPLFWTASVFVIGEISPNQSAYPYGSSADEFSMKLNSEITLKHDRNGWNIPPYDTEKYVVNIGFGMGVNEIFWGCSVRAEPNSTTVLEAVAYEVFRLDSDVPIGSPVSPVSPNAWQIPLGSNDLLSFSASGIGTLTTGSP